MVIEQKSYNNRTQPNSAKRVQDKTRLRGEGDPLEIVENLKSDHTDKRYMQNQNPSWEMKSIKIFWDFKTQTAHQQSKLSDNEQQKKKLEWTFCIVDFIFPWTTQWKSKKARRDASTCSLLKNKERCGTWGWRWYR